MPKAMCVVIENCLYLALEIEKEQGRRHGCCALSTSFNTGNRGIRRAREVGGCQLAPSLDLGAVVSMLYEFMWLR